jgi:hypothetical protein
MSPTTLLLQLLDPVPSSLSHYVPAAASAAASPLHAANTTLSSTPVKAKPASCLFHCLLLAGYFNYTHHQLPACYLPAAASAAACSFCMSTLFMGPASMWYICQRNRIMPQNSGIHVKEKLLQTHHQLEALLARCCVCRCLQRLHEHLVHASNAAHSHHHHYYQHYMTSKLADACPLLRLQLPAASA